MNATEAPHRFDLVIVGAGVSGLALATALAESDLPQRVLLIDEAPDRRDERALSYFNAAPCATDPLARRVWDRLVFASRARTLSLPLSRYRYRTLRAADFRAAAWQQLANHPRIAIRAGHVHHTEARGDGVAVSFTDQEGEHVFSARWLFDSRFPTAFPETTRHDALVQRFVGWEIELGAPVLDPGAAWLFDFGAGAEAGRFHYLLPFSDRIGLFELVTFGAPARDRDLADYIAARVPGVPYRVLRRERGESLLTAAPFARTPAPGIIAIGVAGGLLRASTGYAFTRILDDARGIVRALERGRHPLAYARRGGAYRFFDAVFLRLAASRPGLLPGIFTALFAGNPADRVLAFLDQRASLRELCALIWSLPKRPFLRAFLGWIGVRLGLRSPTRDWPHPRPRKLSSP